MKIVNINYETKPTYTGKSEKQRKNFNSINNIQNTKEGGLGA
jgi:hypothetical protein